MTNDQIRRNDQIRMTKPATSQLRAFGHSGFGFHSSLVIRHWSFAIQRLMQIGFMAPMRAKKASGLSMNRTNPDPSQELSRNLLPPESAALQFGFSHCFGICHWSFVIHQGPPCR